MLSGVAGHFYWQIILSGLLGEILNEDLLISRHLILLTELWLVFVDKFSYSQLLEFIRSEGKGDLLWHVLIQ